MEPDTGRNSWASIDGEIYYLLGATGDYVGKAACKCHSSEAARITPSCAIHTSRYLKAKISSAARTGSRY